MIARIRKIIISFTVYISLFFMFVNSFSSAKADMGGTDILQYLSCEGGFAADVVNYVSPYSCIREPLLDQLVTGLLTLGMSNGMTLRLKMNQEHLYPGNCTRSNRAEYHSPKISFGLCNNTALVAMNIESAITGAIEGFIGGDFSSMIPDVSKYIIDFSNKSPGYYSVFADVTLVTLPKGVNTTLINSLLPPYVAFVYNVDTNQDKICVNILTVAGAFMPVGCKYIKEPYPHSIYQLYGALEQDATSGNDIAACSSVYNCSQKAKKYSHTVAPILSPIISCVREMILRLVISTEVCNPSAISSNTENNIAKAFALGMNTGSMLHKFQTNMQFIVMGLLTLYVIFFGFKIALGGQVKQSELVNFILKFLLVTYFSIGINMGSGANTARFDGMSQLIFPFMLNGVTQVAGWMMNSSSLNGLCEFPSSLYAADADISMSLWDQIDCRLSYYIGYDALVEMVVAGGDDPVKHHIPPYVFFLIPGIILGNFDLIMLALTYPIMIISFVAYTVGMFVSALVLILILGILAPIFVPCALFARTYDYFQNWWQNLFSLMIQPAIALAFLSIMFCVYDRGFYGTCQYRSLNVTYNDPSGSSKTFRSFFISDDSNDYPGGQDEYNLCMSSLGYFLNNPTGTLFGGGTSGHNGSVTINARDPHVAALAEQRPEEVLNGQNGKPTLQWKKGLFTQSPKMVWQELVQMIKNLIVCFTLLTVMQNLMSIINQFVIGLSGGIISAAGRFDSGHIQDKLTQVASQGASKIAQARQGSKETTKKVTKNIGEKGDEKKSS